MRRAAALLAALAASGCTGSLSPGMRVLQGASGLQDFSLPIASFEDRKFASVVRQKYDFSCGSAALATLLHYHYARPAIDEQAVFRGMWANGDRTQIRRLGFSLLDMKRYLASRGLKADGYKVSLEKIADAGLPGIALIAVGTYRHFVVVKGVSATEVLVGDPSTGLQIMRRPAFEAAWNGVYFVINTNSGEGKTAFNLDTQWANFSRAPLGDRLLDPVSLQALSLTAPFYRDY